MAKPYRTHTYERLSSALLESHIAATHGLRNDLAEDDNHGSRDDDCSHTTAKNVVQEDRK